MTLTENHPNAEAYPSVIVEHQHQVDVDKNAYSGQQRHQGNLKVARSIRNVRKEILRNTLNGLLGLLNFCLGWIEMKMQNSTRVALRRIVSTSAHVSPLAIASHE